MADARSSCVYCNVPQTLGTPPAPLSYSQEKEYLPTPILWRYYDSTVRCLTVALYSESVVGVSLAGVVTSRPCDFVAVVVIAADSQSSLVRSQQYPVVRYCVYMRNKKVVYPALFAALLPRFARSTVVHIQCMRRVLSSRYNLSRQTFACASVFRFRDRRCGFTPLLSFVFCWRTGKSGRSRVGPSHERQDVRGALEGDTQRTTNNSENTHFSTLLFLFL